MKKILLIYLVFINTASFSQVKTIKSSGPTIKIINNQSSGFLYNYYNRINYDNMLNKTFNIKDKNEVNRERYNDLNLNILSKNNIIGEIYFSDTITYSSNTNFDIVNSYLSEVLKNSNYIDFDKNKYGLYYFDVKSNLEYPMSNYFNLNYKLLISNNYLILECKQMQTFNISESESEDFEESGMDYYNSKDIGLKVGTFKTYDGKDNVDINRFRKNKAYTQLIYLSVLNNSRMNIKESFNEYLNVLSEQLKYINYEN